MKPIGMIFCAAAVVAAAGGAQAGIGAWFASSSDAAPVAATPATTLAASGAAPLRCRIDAAPTRGGTRLVAVVEADGDVAGRYSFAVEGGGSGGTSTIRQGGAFAATAGVTEVLSETSLSGRFTATLLVDWSGGATRCTASSLTL
ncbi:curli-like amyloid fiber formation chaperone CsgH [Acuticoccus yangtzensis]|uniref:curli-like amyloid fiber formation chaperone CsgH n=1 Tax=Acuticoccus yangtzensis TaxID=1443441 RepID=UPI0009496F42|nr:curli-like amyloid fiber formation chaperone CsgH [Acuticoccus yangtzensis]